MVDFKNFSLLKLIQVLFLKAALLENQVNRILAHARMVVDKGVELIVDFLDHFHAKRLLVEHSQLRVHAF